jgi:hypothetical protein
VPDDHSDLDPFAHRDAEPDAEPDGKRDSEPIDADRYDLAAGVCFAHFAGRRYVYLDAAGTFRPTSVAYHDGSGWYLDGYAFNGSPVRIPAEYDALYSNERRAGGRAPAGPDDDLGVPQPAGRDERVPHPPGRGAAVPGPVGEL